MFVVVSPRAERHLEAADRWWRANRERSQAIREEIGEIVGLLVRSPYLGKAVENPRTPGVRRFYLERIDYHLFYRVDDKRARIVLMALWHARRRPLRL